MTVQLDRFMSPGLDEEVACLGISIEGFVSFSVPPTWPTLTMVGTPAGLPGARLLRIRSSPEASA